MPCHSQRSVFLRRAFTLTCIYITGCARWRLANKPLRGGDDTGSGARGVDGATAAADAAAAQTLLEFEYGWFLDPLVTGAYPPSMVQRVGARLPAFSPAEHAALLGEGADDDGDDGRSGGGRSTIDFVGVNYYTAQWVAHNAASLPGGSVPPPDPNGGAAGGHCWERDWGGISMQARVVAHCFLTRARPSAAS